MTLVVKLDLDIIKKYMCTKMTLIHSVVQKLSSEQTHRQPDTDGQTHRQTDTQTDRHTDSTEIITYHIHRW